MKWWMFTERTVVIISQQIKSGRYTLYLKLTQCCMSIQFSSVAQSCLTLCNPMNRSTPGLPVHHQLPEFTQTHVHQVSNAIQPSHPLFPPSPPAFNPSQHQSLFQWVNSLHEVAKVLEFQLHHQLPMNTQDWSPLGWTGWIPLQSKRLSRVFSNTTVQKHQFFLKPSLLGRLKSHFRKLPWRDRKLPFPLKCL